MKRAPFVLLVTGVLLGTLLSSSLGTWAAPETDPFRQTVPTKTPTPPPGGTSTPRPPQEEPVADTPTPVPPTPTHTWTPQPTEIVPPTSEPSPTTTKPMASPTGSPATPVTVAVWDFGDAPDPTFPSVLASDGVRHAVVEFEWLGEGVDEEEDSLQVGEESWDDGVRVAELEACAQGDLEVTVAVRDREQPQHAYDAQHLVYLNVLVDWDGDGCWGGRVSCPQGSVASEWAVRNLPIDVSSWPEGSTSMAIPLHFPVGPRTGQSWARFSLSYAEVISGEDWDGRGVFAFGETEDHLLTISLASTAAPEVASPTSVVTATPTATPTIPTWVPAEVDIARRLGVAEPLLCFGAGLFLGIALVVVFVAWRRRDSRLLIAGLILTGLVVVVGTERYGARVTDLALFVRTGSPTAPPTPHERLIPTATETREPMAESVLPTPEYTTTPTTPAIIAPTREATETAVQAPASSPGFVVATPVPSLMSVGDRFGFGAAISPISGYAVDQLHAGWYVSWKSELDPLRPQGMEFVQMIRTRGCNYSPHGRELEEIVENNLGSLWIIGNEPDVVWQDNTSPTDYARVYHEVYGLLKGIDPTCRVAIAGVSQATPLRLQYLDTVLEAYEDLYGKKIPVDVWNVHGFILREERGSWGVDIPPGLSVDQGHLFEVEDHDNLDIFREQIVAFRRWMKARGERDKPLIVSEYGILMPEEYGFPRERVRDFMYATFDYFVSARDDDLGYSADGGRLVQRWAWYSLSDTLYPTGNLFDPDTGGITPLGLAYSSYTSSH